MPTLNNEFLAPLGRDFDLNQFGTNLNFNEGPNPCFIADDTVIKIDQVRMKNPDILAQLNIFTNWH